MSIEDYVKLLNYIHKDFHSKYISIINVDSVYDVTCNIIDRVDISYRNIPFICGMPIYICFDIDEYDCTYDKDRSEYMIENIYNWLGKYSI